MIKAQKAIERLDEFCHDTEEIGCSYYDDCRDCEFFAAIEALKKQIPRRLDYLWEERLFICPNCREPMRPHKLMKHYYFDSYCPNCGQKISDIYMEDYDRMRPNFYD